LKPRTGRITGWHGTTTDTTLQVAVQTALRLKDVAEMSSHAKSLFLSQMSHELRTPLNAVLGFAQIMLLDSGLSAKQRAQPHHIKSAGDWRLEMIGDLMDLAQIEAGNLSLKLAPVEVHAVITDTVALLETQASAEGIRLLVNLASNAVKHNRPKGEVRFAVLTDAAAGVVRIHGSGIGLVIVKQLTEAMGGQIAVDSTPERGSTFRVTLARANAPAPPARNA
jgi:signal transduction histidine kinase